MIVEKVDKRSTTVLKLVKLTPSEASILDAASHIEFGELLDVEIEDGNKTEERRISEAQERFIEALRREGLVFLNQIVVHNGQPLQIEIGGVFGKIKYRRKIRFN